MKTLIAFDVIGTLDGPGEGPVPLRLLAELRELGALIVIVAESPRPVGFERRLSVSGDRLENLLIARRDFPAPLRIYVSDNGDETTAGLAGFVYVSADRFAAAFKPQGGNV